MPAPRPPGVQPSRAGGPGPSIPVVRWGRDALIRKTRKIVEAIRAYIAEFTYLIIRDHGTLPTLYVRVSAFGNLLFIEGIEGGVVGKQAGIQIQDGMYTSGHNITLPRRVVDDMITLTEDTSNEVYARINRVGADDYTIELKIGSSWVKLEDVAAAQSKVDTHAADTSTHGVAEVADVATVSAEIDSDITTHATDTSTHGVATVADAAALDDHTEDTSTHGVSKVADDAGIGARVYNNANISIANTTLTALTFNSERYDTDTIHSTASNTSRLTCKTAGKFIITGHVEFELDLGGDQRWVYIRVNGSTIIAQQRIDEIARPAHLSVTTLYNLAVNDYVELIVYQSTGGAIDIVSTSAYSPEFAMQRISA